ncbi:leukocyte-associated immunoglobulin-like receptor 1 isoform X2 [Sus scrofa]|uniref:Leukocyte-associated immunoglobulin-like receptor 1 n=3 Tax=Sus scrofa TaxID=9823 RepID=A0A8D1SV72_PIG|nr:leukocyte-associated immunoglobulin-like receptor 1 isoform X2 [Sus scrofa]
MAPHPTTLLCFGSSSPLGHSPARKGAVGVFLTRTCLAALCLGQTIRTCRGALPRPSIRAEPGPVVPWGQPVTIVCQGPAGAETFRLQYKENMHKYKDESNTIQIGPHQTAARFPIAAVSEDTVRHYQCLYHQSGIWSESSETLKLVLTGDTWTHSQDGNNPGPWTEHVYILIGVSAAFLLCLLLLVLLLLQRWHQRKRGPPRNKGKEPEPQERLSPAVDVLDGTPDPATVHRLPEKDRETEASTPADLQEVTYAQLDHRTLTQRAARAVTPPSTEPAAESSTYAAISRH